MAYARDSRILEASLVLLYSDLSDAGKQDYAVEAAFEGRVPSLAAIQLERDYLQHMANVLLPMRRLVEHEKVLATIDPTLRHAHILKTQELANAIMGQMPELRRSADRVLAATLRCEKIEDTAPPNSAAIAVTTHPYSTEKCSYSSVNSSLRSSSS